MNPKQIFEALLAGKKVGESDRFYVYLNIAGDLMGEYLDSHDTADTVLSSLIYYGNAKVIAEEGP